MRAKPRLLIAALLILATASQKSPAQYCVHLQWPIWSYGSGTILYHAHRTEGNCFDDCNTLTPVYHADSDFYLSLIPQNCEDDQGIQFSLTGRQSSLAGRQSRTPKGKLGTRPDRVAASGLQRPVAPDYDFFTTWDSEDAPQALRLGGEIRRCTDCSSSRNFVLISPNGDERIKVRIFEVVATTRKGGTRHYYVAYERSGPAGEGHLQAAELVTQEDASGCSRFTLKNPEISPYPGADQILLMRAAAK